MMNKPRFIIDSMLGNLATKLRLLGFDSKFYSDINDIKLMEIAKNENRMLVTKDVQLARLSTKRQVEVIQITEYDEIEQFFQINNKVRLERCFIKGDSARCTLCNGLLHNIEKKYVKEKISMVLIERVDNFWECMDCKKIYWEGTHIKNLQQFVDKLNDRLSKNIRC